MEPDWEIVDRGQCKPQEIERESIDWESEYTIDPRYITEIRIRINKNFSSPYPSKHFNESLSLCPNRFYKDPEVLHLYNPYSLRLPDALYTVYCLFNRPKIADAPPSSGQISTKTAQERFLNFLREYNLLYVDVLEAINGYEEALDEIEKKLETDILYERAGIATEHLGRGTQYDTFRRACFAHIVIDVLRSREERITTTARARALELLSSFEEDNNITLAFAKHNSGFKLSNNEPVHDLIPLSFIDIERKGAPHNNLFVNNVTIQKIFGCPSTFLSSDINTRKFNAGISKLLEIHPAETVQTLLSILRLPHTNSEAFILAFKKLVKLSQLDESNKSEVFGAGASFRVDGPHEDLNDDDDDNELDSLAAGQLRASLRQSLDYTALLEDKLAKTAYPARFREHCRQVLARFRSSDRSDKGKYKELQ